MNPSHIEHIGIAVSDLEASISFYERVFGLKCYKIEDVPDQKVRTAFFSVGQTKIELLESTDPESTIGKFIEKRGEGIHHIAFEVEDIDQALEELKAKGVPLVDQQARPGAHQAKIAFLHPKGTYGILIELVQYSH
jgi:methylmalonyl-CoA/ethylmalonyl-CoA epimerase